MKFTSIDTASVEENESNNPEDELISSSANYQGDWTLLLRERMLDPVTKERFIKQRDEAMPAMLTGKSNGLLDRSEEFKQHYQDQIDHYEDRVNHIFSMTGMGLAGRYAQSPISLGEGDIDKPGIVFSDAIKGDGMPLTAHQKNIVESHEKGHGLRDFHSLLDKTEIRSVVDFKELDELTKERRIAEGGFRTQRFVPGYLSKPDEIIERMSQFKNYFGMKASDIFTKKHLDYVRQHYVADIGLDNGVNDLLRCVTPSTEEAFLYVINKYPI